MGESDGRREEAVSDVSFLEGTKNSRRDSASCQNRALSRARALGRYTLSVVLSMEEYERYYVS
jgi:hypothetical protein